MADYSNWDDWLSELPEIYEQRRRNPDTYLLALRRHLEQVPDKKAGPNRSRVIRELNRRLRGLGRIAHAGARSRVIFGLSMAGASFAAALIAPLAPAVALGGLAIALNELRTDQDNRRVQRTADELEKVIDSLIQQLEDEA